MATPVRVCLAGPKPSMIAHFRCNVKRSSASRRIARPAVVLKAVATQAGPARPAGASTVTVTFTINQRLKFGQQMVLVGDAEALGGWVLERAPAMTWSEGDDWIASLEMPAGAPFEYKFAIKEEGCAPIWETCENRRWDAHLPGATLACSWDSVDVTTAAASRSMEPPLLDLPPAYRPAQPFTPFPGQGAVTAVKGAVAAASGAAAAADAVMAAADAAAAAVAEAVKAAEAVVAELSAAQSSAALKAQTPNGAVAAFTPEQLAFLERKRSQSPGTNGAATAVAAPPDSPHNAAAAAEAVLAATNAAAGAAARVVAVAESVAAELTSATPAVPATASNSTHHAPVRAAAVNNRANGAPTARPAAPVVTPAAPAGNYSPEQLEFLRRKLNSQVQGQSAIKPSEVGRDAAVSRSSAPRSSAPAPPAPVGNYTPEQLAFLQRKGQMPQAASAPAPEAPAPAVRSASPSRHSRPASRPPARPSSPSSSSANGTAQHAQYSPEQLAFLRRAGKL